MNASGNSVQEQSTALERSAASAHSATASTPSEQMLSADAPYASAQPTPSAAIKKQSMLPPIAIAQPQDTMNPIQSQLHGGSNIPVNPNAPQGIYHSGDNGTDLSHPYVTVVAVAPPGELRDAQLDNTRFASLKKCRWFALCLMMYYMITFFFGQPFVLITFGMFTALIGFNGSRSPVDMQRFKWLRWYIRANYFMLVLNMWMLIVTLVLPSTIFSYASDADSSDGASSEADMSTNTNHFYSNSYGFFIGFIVAANTIMHLRCLLTAQHLIAELKAAGIDRQPALDIVLANENAASAV